MAAIVESGASDIKHRFLKTSRGKGAHWSTITVSVSSFVPKPFTPFQWVAMDERQDPETQQDQHASSGGLKRTVPNVRVHAERAPLGLRAGADRPGETGNVADILHLAHHNQGNWPQTFKAFGGQWPHFYCARCRAGF